MGSTTRMCVALILIGGLVLLLGCGGGGGGGVAGPPQDVMLQASVVVAGSGVGAAQGGAVDVVVEVKSPGDTLDIPASATVTHVLPDSSTQDLTGNLVRDPGGRKVTLTSFSATQIGIHRVKISGPGGGAILRDGNEPPSSLMLGLIELGFEVRADRSVAPAPIAVTLPTRGTTLNDSATFDGLQIGDVVETQVHTNTGVTITKTATVTSGTSVTIVDVSGGIKASAINGPNSWLKALARQGP